MSMSMRGATKRFPKGWLVATEQQDIAWESRPHVYESIGGNILLSKASKAKSGGREKYYIDLDEEHPYIAKEVRDGNTTSLRMFCKVQGYNTPEADYLVLEDTFNPDQKEKEDEECK